MIDTLTKPIFIVGCPRSGTTILAKILNNHSQIASATEIHFFNHLIKSKKYNWQVLNDKLLQEFFAETRIEDFCSLLKIDFQEFSETILQNTEPDLNLFIEEQNQKRIFDALMLMLLKRNKKTNCCEKTPQHLLNIDEILRFYPNAKIIHLIRDGRDTVNSLIKMPWRPEGLLNNSRFWKRYAKLGIAIANKYANKVDNYISIRYEDLLYDPVTSIKRLCLFCDYQFETQMLDTQEQKDSNIFSAWESSWKHKAMEELDSTRVGAWQKELNEKEQRLLNWHLRHELKVLGYENPQKDFTLVDSINVFKEYTNLAFEKSTRLFTDLIS